MGVGGEKTGLPDDTQKKLRNSTTEYGTHYYKTWYKMMNAVQCSFRNLLQYDVLQYKYCIIVPVR
jgi:hypothetical protein